MKFTISYGCLTVTKEPTDTKRYTNSEWGRAESNLLYDIKKALTALGVPDIIKKLMWKDGHLVDDTQHYLRTRNHRVKGPHIYISDGMYAVRDLAEGWKQDGKITLNVDYDVFEKHGEEADRLMLEEIINAKKIIMTREIEEWMDEFVCTTFVKF